LAEAHERGLIHRDIKPAHVYVCRYGRETDFIKVLDFGLVKPAPSQKDAAVELTMTGMAGGTPAFMAPEQVLGKGDVDARTDIYAIGGVAYWLLTGQMVFEGETPMDVMTHQVRTPATPPSKRTELPIPPALDAIVMACLEKDPARRPASADDLSCALTSSLPEARWSSERAQQWWDRHSPKVLDVA
jgi:serine/threonine-protein kinase